MPHIVILIINYTIVIPLPEEVGRYHVSVKYCITSHTVNSSVSPKGGYQGAHPLPFFLDLGEPLNSVSMEKNT